MRRISISVLGVSATPLKTIPALLEESDLFEFTLGPEPIIKLIAWEAVTLKINLISASSDFFVAWRVICRNFFYLRLIGTGVMPQSHISPVFRCHSRSLSRT